MCVYVCVYVYACVCVCVCVCVCISVYVLTNVSVLYRHIIVTAVCTNVVTYLVQYGVRTVKYEHVHLASCVRTCFCMFTHLLKKSILYDTWYMLYSVFFYRNDRIMYTL